MGLSQRAILTPLVGLVIAWAFFMFAAWSNLYVQPEYDAGGAWISDGPIVRPSTFLYLAGIAAFALAALSGLKTSGAQRARNDSEDGLTLAAYRFGNLTVIIALAGGAIFALANFFGAFGGSTAEGSLLERLVGVYLPILLATALVVTVLLLAFVFRDDKTEDRSASKKGLDPRQKALGLGYAIPIIAAAIAVIFGLVVYDVTGTSLEAWVWVIIQVIIAAGIILGTHYARMAKAEKPAPAKPRTAWASGAWNLNFVLSIVFGAVVSVMAFVFGIGSFEELRDYNFDYAGWEVLPISLNWVVGDFAPAVVLILLVTIGLYATMTERHRAR
ncbi:MAG: hypothetical protein HOJ98_02440 [Microbacteriaceae bacterium]|nr:hypothetical protein [Microbacteriaceae bacterium]